MVGFFPIVQLTPGSKKRIIPHKRKLILLFYLVTNYIPKYQPKNKIVFLIFKFYIHFEKQVMLNQTY